MRGVFYIHPSSSQRGRLEALAEGARACGVEAVFTNYREVRPGGFAVIWAYKQKRVIRYMQEARRPLLVMEIGHLHPRDEMVSLGWNGLCGRAARPRGKGPDRWDRMFADRMRPWRDDGDCALIFGQCDGDAALAGVNFRKWVNRTCAELVARGERVVYRPHPIMLRQGEHWRPEGAELSRRTLEEDLGRARFAVSWNSTAATDAVLAGVPCVTFDQGAMAWDVTSHSLKDPLWRGDRRAWASDLAWTTWTLDELRDGTAWRAIREVMP